jgi:hypothetical protein
MVGTGRLPFFVKLAVATLFFPAFFSIGSITLSPSKLLFLFTVPVLTINLIRGEYGRIIPTDFFVFLYSAWMALAVLKNNEVRVALEYVGSNIIIIIGGYLTGRAFIRNKYEFIGFIKLLLLVIAISLPFALYEAGTSVALIPRWIGSLPGLDSNIDVMNRSDDQRLGLWRAQFGLPHSIHYGLFCSLLFSFCYIGLFAHVSSFNRMLCSLLVAFCCFLSVSSGPFLSLLCQVALIAWLRMTWWTEARWKILWAILIVSYSIIEVASNRIGIYAVVERLAFSPETAYYRRLLFTFGTDQIAQTPIFGVGLNPWGIPDWMTGSLDNFWLFLAVLYGMPTLIFFFLAILSAIFSVARRDFYNFPDLLRFRQAWIFTIVSLCLTLATVTIWGETYSLVLLVFSSGLWMITFSTEMSSEIREVGEPPQRRAPVYTRFPHREKPEQGGRVCGNSRRSEAAEVSKLPRRDGGERGAGTPSLKSSR